MDIICVSVTGMLPYTSLRHSDHFKQSTSSRWSSFAPFALLSRSEPMSDNCIFYTVKEADLESPLVGQPIAWRLVVSRWLPISIIKLSDTLKRYF